MTPKAKAILPLPPELTPKAKTAFAFDDIKSGALLSIGQLCDDDCIAIFSKYNFKIKKMTKYLSKVDGHQTDYGKYLLAQPHNHRQKTTLQ